MSNLDLRKGDCIKQLKKIPSNSVHSVVTDPPYNISFDGSKWDSFSSNTSFSKWCQEWAYQCLRVLRPGGYMISFSASRTYHRMVTGIEDAGFDIKDQINWLYFSGMPKSLALGKKDKRLKGWSSTLKPCFEPAMLAQKPLSEANVSSQILKSRTGALRIDACRFPYGDSCWVGPQHDHSKAWDKPVSTSMVKGGTYHQNGIRKTVDLSSYKPVGGRYPGNIFQCKKPSKKEKNMGLRQTEGINQNTHPTVKPLKLMKWCIRLITAEGGTVLDPFLGSGTTAIAAVLQDYKCIGIELNPMYQDIIIRRVGWFEAEMERRKEMSL